MCCFDCCHQVSCENVLWFIAAPPLIIGAVATFAGIVSSVSAVALPFFLAKSAWLGCKSLSDSSVSFRATLIGTGHILLLSVPVIGILVFLALELLGVQGFADHDSIEQWFIPFLNCLGDSLCGCF